MIVISKCPKCEKTYTSEVIDFVCPTCRVKVLVASVDYTKKSPTFDEAMQFAKETIK